MGKRVVIDTIACTGCESCVELCPEVFEFDEQVYNLDVPFFNFDLGLFLPGGYSA